MAAITAEAKARRRQQANKRHRERYKKDPLYREACKTRQRERRAARAEAKRERYATDKAFRVKLDVKRSARRKEVRITINDDRPFVGCDGEGVGRGPDSRYALFRMGDRELGPYPGDRALTTPELLRFICAAPPDPIYVGFAFEYDISNILRNVPHHRNGPIPSRLDRIMRRDVASLSGAKNAYGHQSRWTWLTFDGFPTYGVNYLARNHLSVCRGEKVGDRIRAVKGSTRTIYDVFGNFQSSFVNALEKWDFGFKHRATIERMKRQRESFSTITQEIRDYCKLECQLLGELMDEFRSVCLSVDLRPKTWNGAGKLASALHHTMQTIRAAELEKLLPAGLKRTAHAAYYGGRFEVTRLGMICDEVFEHDIVSAYPAHMLTLPCLRHGEWVQASGAELAKLPADAIYVAPVRFTHPYDQFLCGLPIRDKAGSLSWPRNGNGVYWSCEIRSAIRLGATIEHRAGWRYVKHCDCELFAKVPVMFKLRQSIGKGRKGIPIKLSINALYGKLAQRVGNPQFGNPVWAGLITAKTRAQLNDAIAQDPQRVAMIATDGIYTIGKPLDLEQGDWLGQWEIKKYPSLFIVQPGLYWPPRPEDTKERRVKSRGVSASVFEPFTDRFENAWQRYVMALGDEKTFVGDLIGGITVPRPAVNIALTMFIGLRLAYHRAGRSGDAAKWKASELCQWVETSKKISFDWKGKRSDLTITADRSGVLGSLAGSALLTSHTYTEAGLENPDAEQWWSRLELEAMPDGGAAFGPPRWGD